MKIFISVFFICFIGTKRLSFQISNSDYRQLRVLYEKNQFDSIVKINQNTLIINNPKKEGDIYYLFAKVFYKLNEDDKAFEYFLKAKAFFKDENDLEKIAIVNKELYFLVDSLDNLDVDKTEYINEIKDYAFNTQSEKWMLVYYNLLGIYYLDLEKQDFSKHYFIKANELAKKMDSISASINIFINLGVLHLNQFQQPDSAIQYYSKALEFTKREDYQGDLTLDQFDLFNNIARAYFEKGDYLRSLEFYQNADKLELINNSDNYKRLLYENITDNYYNLGDFKNAYKYLSKYDSLNKILNFQDQKEKIAEINAKYETAEKERKILEQENEIFKEKQNKNIAIGAGSGLAFISIIGFLYFNNKKKKQEIALQNQVIEQEMLKSKLKDVELKSVDAMIEGQEKERLNIANELHDELGSLMATIKMHFSSIQTDTSNEIYTKTNGLIENAYQKIRNISHSKNSGVLANKGLLKALKDLANTVSLSNQIEIKVYDNGLEQRIANSMELTLFRILQELIANTIKHAKASQVDIHLTMDEEHLNIMVEDNGLGFKVEENSKQRKGMGLLNIEKRIENLGGQMVIESQPGKGTSVILDISL